MENKPACSIIVHAKGSDVSSYLIDAITHRTEVFDEGRRTQYCVTGVVYAHGDPDFPNDPSTPSTFVIHPDAVTYRFRNILELIENVTNYRTVRQFIDRGRRAISLAILGGHYYNNDYLEDTTVVDENDCSWDDLGEFLVAFYLGMCLCGEPETVLEFIYDGLSFINIEVPEEGKFEERFAEYWAARKVVETKYTDGPLYFLWHHLENLGLLIHGSSAPGQFTATGQEYFYLLQLEMTEENEQTSL